MLAATSSKLNYIVVAGEIPQLKHADAPALATTEYEQLLRLLDSLHGDDWRQPTYCSEWNVRDIVAHLAGAVAAYASWGEFSRQFLLNPYVRSAKTPVDGVNRRQLEDRASASNEELIAEFRTLAPKAIRVRHRIPWPISQLPILKGEAVIDERFRYLLDVVYTRDWWLHRLDICAATGKTMSAVPGHDRHIVDLILIDLAHMLGRRGLGNRSIHLTLTGAVQQSVLFGGRSPLSTNLRMDTFDFALITSERIAPSDAFSRSQIEGDADVARWFTQNCSVTY